MTVRRLWKRARSRAARLMPWRGRPRASEGRLFIVAEEGRPYFYRQWLDWAREHDPGLRARIDLGRLPATLPANTKVLHAWVQDPVRERSDTAFQQLERLEERARRARADIIHPARVLSNSLRDVMFERLTRAGLRSPRIVDVGPGFGENLGGLGLPIIVRKSWGHIGPMLRLDSKADVAKWIEQQGAALDEWVAAEYIEVRDPDGYYRKYRYILFGDRGVTRHLIVSAEWEVRPKGRILTDDTIAEELAFVGAPCDKHDMFNAARMKLEFDIAAFDYSFDESGDMIVWEVNPYPDLSRPKGRPGEYLAGSVFRTNEALADLYHDRLAAAGPRRWAVRPS